MNYAIEFVADGVVSDGSAVIDVVIEDEIEVTVNG